MQLRRVVLGAIASLAGFTAETTGEMDSCDAGREGCLSVFQLFSDFDVSHHIETQPDKYWNWDNLVKLRRTRRRPTWSFYIDKVAYKRHLQAVGVQIPKPMLLKHASEWDSDDKVYDAIFTTTKDRENYVAKPTHLSTSDGVFVIKDSNYNIMEKKKVTPFKVSAKVAMTMDQKPHFGESWALFQVPAGVVVEERLTHWEDDSKAAIEFKVFTIWGKVWQAKWRRGEYTYGVAFRNGTMHTKSQESTLPSWVNWDRVVSIAEKLGANKDMFRTDIFVGVPAGSSKGSELMYAVSEAEIHPTTSMDSFSGFSEAAALWLEGYRKKTFQIISNHEIPLWWSPRYGRPSDN